MLIPLQVVASHIVGKAVKKKDFSQEFLSEYEKRWKEAFGQKIKRNYIVKEILLDMDDKTFNKIAHSLQDIVFDEISTYGLIKAIVKKHPTLMMKLAPLLKYRKKLKEIEAE
jgi:digeranylgeranylglycerophospholipid reductase